MAADTFTKDRMAWLERVQDDRGLTPSAFSIAFAIARHLNRRTGQAFPSREALAAMTGLRPRQVTDLVHALRGRGHLAMRRRRNKSTVYTLTMGPDVQPAALPDVQRSAVPEDQEVQSSAPRTCNPPHIGMCTPPQPNPLKEPSEEEPFDVEGARGDLFGEIRKAEAVKSAKRGQRFVPASWTPPGDTFEFGASLGMTTARVERETAIFRDHEFKTPHTDWTKAWRNWIRRGSAGRSSHPSTSHRQSASDMAAEALEIFE